MFVFTRGYVKNDRWTPHYVTIRGFIALFLPHSRLENFYVWWSSEVNGWHRPALRGVLHGIVALASLGVLFLLAWPPKMRGCVCWVGPVKIHENSCWYSLLKAWCLWSLFSLPPSGSMMLLGSSRWSFRTSVVVSQQAMIPWPTLISAPGSFLGLEVGCGWKALVMMWRSQESRRVFFLQHLDSFRLGFGEPWAWDAWGFSSFFWVMALPSSLDCYQNSGCALQRYWVRNCLVFWSTTMFWAQGRGWGWRTVLGLRFGSVVPFTCSSI